jgi:hypothetical protein
MAIPENVGGYEKHLPRSFAGEIISIPHSLVTLAMHARPPLRKRLKQIRATAESLPDPPRLDDLPINRSSLPRRVGQPVTMPTTPALIPWRVKLHDPPAAFADEEMPNAAKRARLVDDGDLLIIDGEPMSVPNDQRRAINPIPSETEQSLSRRRKKRGVSKGRNIEASRAFYCSTSASGASSQIEISWRLTLTRLTHG